MTSEKSKRSSNDQRSDANNPTSTEYKAAQNYNWNLHNPTSPEYKAAADNRANNMNPNNPAHRGGKVKK
jgi:hypothetical protein